jgi:hypothetical protein
MAAFIGTLALASLVGLQISALILNPLFLLKIPKPFEIKSNCLHSHSKLQITA